jgi:hypothetical protein
MFGEMVAPLTPLVEQTSGVVDVENDTGSPDDAVAVTTRAGSFMNRSAIGANVIVWAVVPNADPADQVTTGATSALAARASTAKVARRRIRNSPLGTPRTVPAPERANAAIHSPERLTQAT